jgi:tRNA dimethylallyltransferase
LDILTNKVTKAEMKGIPHHMLSIVEPQSKFDVTHFRNQALPLVSSELYSYYTF